MVKRRSPFRGRLRLVAIPVVVAVAACFGGAAASAPRAEAPVTITVNTLPIANALPLDLGIQKGFFATQGIEIKKNTLQSGNDIVLALANNNGDIGYIGYTPAMIGRTQGIPITVVAASETEGTSEADNWQNVVTRSGSIQRPADLVGKTVALNALKGVAEIVVRGSLDKLGVDSSSVKYTVIPFPAMPAALANGLVDAVHTPEPFMSQILAAGGHIVLAPGPVLGKYWPNGCYCAREDWVRKNPGLVQRFRTAINQSLVYANSHPDEIRALLPAAIRNIRLPTWSPLVDRVQLFELARLAKKYGAIATMPNMTKFVPSFVEGGRTLQATVGGGSFLTLRLDGKVVTRLRAGKYTVAVADKSTKDNFHLVGAGVDKATSVAKRESATWILTLKKGVYRYSSDGSAKRKTIVRVT
jgi:NitT/TauT family transport system substrate-binding protein